MDGRRARKLLGVGSNAGPDEIRRAFRARVLVTHPDHGGSAAAFAETCAAFEALQRATPRPHVRPTLPAMRPVTRVDVYDSPARPAPRRDFADVLRAATARFN